MGVILTCAFLKKLLTAENAEDAAEIAQKFRGNKDFSLAWYCCIHIGFGFGADWQRMRALDAPFRPQEFGHSRKLA
jgi:hypothetical protein